MHHLVTCLVEQPVLHALYVIADEAVFFVKDFVDSAFFLLMFVLKNFIYSIHNFSVDNINRDVEYYVVDAQLKLPDLKTFITSNGAQLTFLASRPVIELDTINGIIFMYTRWYFVGCLKIYIGLITLRFHMPILGLNSYLLPIVEEVFRLTDPFMNIWFNKVPAVLGLDVGVLLGIHIISMINQFLLSIIVLTPDGQEYKLWTTGIEIMDLVVGKSSLFQFQ